MLVPFDDGPRMGEAVADLLVDGPARQVMANNAYVASRPMIWAHVAQRYGEAFREALRSPVGIRLRAGRAAPLALPILPLPATSNRHFKAMCDDTGLFQHAIRSIPDRRHGYCVDDNARALLLCIQPDNRLDGALALAAHFASFVQHAWNSDYRRFRNFMSFERRWLEPAGSQDSHGRTLWALGVCAASSDPGLAAWATDLFVEALPTVLEFTAPRSWAFALLGLDAYCPVHPGDTVADAIRHRLAGRLVRLLRDTATDPWPWFEDRLTYDNARLCEALIRTGGASATRTCWRRVWPACAGCWGCRRRQPGISAPSDRKASCWPNAHLCPSINSRWKPARPWRPAVRRGSTTEASSGYRRPIRLLPGSWGERSGRVACGHRKR
jgi:hypothetical protein